MLSEYQSNIQRENFFRFYLIHTHINIFQLFLTFCDVIYERLRLRYFQISELNESSGCHLLDRFVFYGNTSIIKSDCAAVTQMIIWVGSFNLFQKMINAIQIDKCDIHGMQNIEPNSFLQRYLPYDIILIDQFHDENVFTWSNICIIS